MSLLTQQTIEIYRGEQVVIPFAMDPPENIAGWTLKFTASKTVERLTKLLGPLSVNVTNAATGLFEITLTEEQTDIKQGSYVFDVWRTDEGFEQPKAIGPFIVVGNARVPPTAT